jgi:hypothetical protein
MEKSEGIQPRQLFVTKNDVLRNEVEKSFRNMGLAWRKRVSCHPENATRAASEDDIKVINLLSDFESSPEYDLTRMVSGASQSNEIGSPGLTFPLFLTSSEWLDILDCELPGRRFFNQVEVEHRADTRREDDAVQRGMEAFFSIDKSAKQEQKVVMRREMSFQIFRKLWRKMNSQIKTSMDPALVWLEIKSHIKGSVAALQLDDTDRSTRDHRFLRLLEYLNLPRKQSRIDESQRRIVHELYQSYEKLKIEGNYCNVMDVVYNLAGRICQVPRDSKEKLRGLLPVNAMFIDEVQDFTQSELFLLTKLCSDPNNLMLAGDTAQSIAVGVGFRFTDVRQIFFNAFGGAEPDLLRLTHNYRSHAGILRLAASVVELLYFFFSDSLDKLPPDFGLFQGPKPVLMEVSSVTDLVLMLDGSKRETSRIEFGAHQVVIVRSEEAKNALPEEFDVDKDWVMTVSCSMAQRSRLFSTSKYPNNVTSYSLRRIKMSCRRKPPHC